MPLFAWRAWRALWLLFIRGTCKIRVPAKISWTDTPQSRIKAQPICTRSRTSTVPGFHRKTAVKREWMLVLGQFERETQKPLWIGVCG